MNFISSNPSRSTRRLASAIALLALLTTGCQANGNSNSNASQPPGTLQAAATEATSAPTTANATQAAAAQPVTNQPVAAQPVATQPVAAQPVTAQPVAAPAPQSPAPSSNPEPIANEPTPIAQLSPNDPNNEWFYEDRPGPESGTIRGLEQRETGCILSLQVPAGQTYKLYGTAEVCADATLAERVTLTYDRVTTPTCSDVTDDCARMAVTQIQQAEAISSNQSASANSPASHPSRNGEAVYTEYRNEKRSILVTSAEPWSGENGTGDFTFQRCDVDREQCDEVVTGGKAQCNEQVCTIVWDGIAQHSITEPKFDSEAIANYLFIWNYHQAAINEPIDRYGETFF